jgi:hypothetical protein
MALGLGYGLPFSVKRPVQGFSEDVALSVNNALADAAQREEAGNCLAARAIDIMQTVQTQPSLLIVPQLYKAGVLYDQLPTTRTNFIPNNSMAGATGSVLPTTWASGSIPAGFTFSVGASGQATANDGTVVNYVDVSVSGTATASGTFNLFFSAATGAVTATTGQTFTLSAYATCISGDITTPAMVLQVQEVSGSTFQAGISTNIALASGAALQRVSAVRTFNQSGVTAARGRIGHPIVSGTTYNYTIRIGSPQLERLSVPTPMIATSTGAVTRLNESTDVVGLPPEFSVSRNTTATRVNSSGLIESVASGVPRIDWLGQSCPALLVEASGQNLAFHSESWVSGNNWTLTDATNVTGATSAPNGNATANALSPTAASGSHFVFSNGTTTVSYTSGTIYTQSAFFKAGTGAAGQFVQLTFPSARFTQTGYANFDLIAGTVSVVSGSSADANRAARIENYGDGWYRCIFTATCNSTGTGAGLIIALITSTGSSRIPSFSGVTGDVLYGSGAQVETGSVATTYIPTTTAAVSRAADTISASGALVSGLIGQTEGTIYAEVDLKNFEQNARIIALSDGTTNNRITLIFNTASRFRLLANVSTSGQVDLSSSAQVSGIYKVAVAYKENDYAFYLNGTQIGTDTSALVPACTSVFLGKIESSASTNFLNDRIRAAALYTTRLSNDQLAELTRL